MLILLRGEEVPPLERRRCPGQCMLNPTCPLLQAQRVPGVVHRHSTVPLPRLFDIRRRRCLLRGILHILAGRVFRRSKHQYPGIFVISISDLQSSLRSIVVQTGREFCS